MQTPADLARLTELKAKLKAREGKRAAIYRDNIEALKAEIARLEALHNDD